MVGRCLRSACWPRPSRRFAAPDLWPCWVLSNHDQPRHRTRYGGSEARARAAAVVLLTLRGTPCLYAGRGARPARRRRPRRVARRSGRPRRLTRADSLGRDAGARLAGAALASVAAGARAAERRERGRRSRLDPRALPTPARATAELRSAQARELAPARRRRRARSSTSGAGAHDVRRVAVNFTEQSRRATSLRRRLAASSSRPTEAN